MRGTRAGAQHSRACTMRRTCGGGDCAQPFEPLEAGAGEGGRAEALRRGGAGTTLLVAPWLVRLRIKNSSWLGEQEATSSGVSSPSCTYACRRACAAVARAEQRAASQGCCLQTGRAARPVSVGGWLRFGRTGAARHARAHGMASQPL